MMSPINRSMFGFDILANTKPKTGVSISLENLNPSKFSFAPIPKITDPNMLATLESLQKFEEDGETQVSQEAVGMSNMIKMEEPPPSPAIWTTVSDHLHLVSIIQPVIAPCLVAKLIAYIDATTSEDTIMLRVSSWLNDDTWLSLCSALATCKATTILCLDFLYNVAAVLVLAVVNEIKTGPCSYFVMDSPVDRQAGGSINDVEFIMDSYKQIHERVIDFGVRSKLFTKEELTSIYDESAIFGLFGDNLQTRIAQRIRITS